MAPHQQFCASTIPVVDAETATPEKSQRASTGPPLKVAATPVAVLKRHPSRTGRWSLSLVKVPVEAPLKTQSWISGLELAITSSASEAPP